MNRRDALARAAWILGGVFSAPTIQAMSHWEQATTSLTGSTPVSPFLDETQREIMSRVADLILPRTDTPGETSPGALDVGVPEFIELMLRDCYKKPEQDAFMVGIGELSRMGFITQKADQQVATLTQVEANARKSTQPSFWTLTKELTLLGYFTSEAGVKASFDYQPIPGKFEAIKIKPGQKDFMYGNQA